jgi:nucleotide-binding universal stress UspA family protein
MLRTEQMLDHSLVDVGKGESSVLPASLPAIVLGQEPSRVATHVLVAGYDGSDNGQAAVVEAGLQAGESGCVFVVYAYAGPPRLLGSPYYDRRLSRARAIGREALSELLLGETSLPNAEYIPELIEGRPPEVIARVASARHADAIVVGPSQARGLRRNRASVSHKLERTVRVPVITIH